MKSLPVFWRRASSAISASSACGRAASSMPLTAANPARSGIVSMSKTRVGCMARAANKNRHFTLSMQGGVEFGCGDQGVQIGHGNLVQRNIQLLRIRGQCLDVVVFAG